MPDFHPQNTHFPSFCQKTKEIKKKREEKASGGSEAEGEKKKRRKKREEKREKEKEEKERKRKKRKMRFILRVLPFIMHPFVLMLSVHGVLHGLCLCGFRWFKSCS